MIQEFVKLDFSSEVFTVDRKSKLIKKRIFEIIEKGQPEDLASRYFDFFLVMTVNPGFGGQAFMPECLPKVERIRALRPEADIQVDGGINAATIVDARRAGANIFVAGNAVFRSESYADAIRELRAGAENDGAPGE